MPETVTPAAAPEAVSFYSRLAGLKIFSPVGEISFTPMGIQSNTGVWGGDNWGLLTTTNPKIIEFLKQRMAEQGEGSDVKTQQQWNMEMEITSKGARAVAAEQASKVRQQDAILAHLREQGVIDDSGRLIPPKGGKPDPKPDPKPDNDAQQAAGGGKK